MTQRDDTELQLVLESIQLLMWRQRVTQAELAAVLGVGQSTLSKKLHGRVPLTVVELQRIAARLGVTAVELLDQLPPAVAQVHAARAGRPA